MFGAAHHVCCLDSDNSMETAQRLSARLYVFSNSCKERIQNSLVSQYKQLEDLPYIRSCSYRQECSNNNSIGFSAVRIKHKFANCAQTCFGNKFEYDVLKSVQELPSLAERQKICVSQINQILTFMNDRAVIDDDRIIGDRCV